MAERLRRYVQVVVNFVGVGSIPTGRTLFSPHRQIVGTITSSAWVLPTIEGPRWRNRQRARLLTGRF